jgi:hypothetical protein
MSQKRETYLLRAKPGKSPQTAAEKMSRYIIDRWIPGNAGGAHVLMGPGLTKLLLQFFKRPTPTKLRVDTRGSKPVITEIPG